MAETKRLLNARTTKSCTAGSNPALSANLFLVFAEIACQTTIGVNMSQLKVSTEELKKAVDSLKIALNLYHKTQKEQADDNLQKALRDSCIQRFEYSIELCWKTSMKILGNQTTAAKVAIREMARNDLVTNPEIWLSFIESRNETSHAYDEDIAQRVFKQIELFLPESIKLLKNLEKQNS